MLPPRCLSIAVDSDIGQIYIGISISAETFGHDVVPSASAFGIDKLILAAERRSDVKTVDGRGRGCRKSEETGVIACGLAVEPSAVVSMDGNRYEPVAEVLGEAFDDNVSLGAIAAGGAGVFLENDTAGCPESEVLDRLAYRSGAAAVDEFNGIICLGAAAIGRFFPNLN